MAEKEAEKKNIAHLKFDVSEALQNLNRVNQELEKIAKSSNAYAETIGKNLNKSINSNKIINVSEIKGSLMSVDESIAKYGKNVTNTLLKGQNQAEKAEQAKALAAQKSAERQISYNQRVAESTESLYDKITKYAKTYVIYEGFNALKKAISATIDEMVRVEQQMVAIDRVMNVSGMDIDDFRDKLVQLAYDYGNSFDNVADVSLRLAQAGIKSANNLKLTEKTLLALNTAELDATQATDDMVAVMSQWNLITDDATSTAKEYGDIIDKVNKVADNFPTTSADILDALKKTSSAFNLAGASINETIATIVAAEKASQRGGKVIGTALSNITQQLKQEGKVDIAESLGISFFADEAKTQYKSIMEIFQALSDKMAQLKKEGKESSLEMQQLLSVFTVFRRNIGASLLGEMAGEESTYAKVLKTTSEAIGYSMEENSKYMKTAKAAQEQFNATLLQLKTEVWDNKVENVYRGLLSSGTDFIKWMQDLSKNMKLLPAVIGTAVAGFSLLGKKIDANSLKKYTVNLKEMQKAMQLYNRSTVDGSAKVEQFYKHLGKDVPNALSNYTKSLKGAEASMSGLIANTVLQTAKQLALNLAIAAGEAAISFGLSLAIQGLVGLIGNWIHATENAAKSVGEMNDKIKSGSDDLNTYVDRFTDLRKEMESSNLTQEELNKKKSELKDLEKELIDKFGDEAKGINLVTGKIKEQTKAIEDLNKADYNKYLQENEKEIKKLSESLNKDITLKLPEMFKTKGGLHSDLYDSLYKFLDENFMQMSEKQVGDATFFNVANIGKPEEILEYYRAVYDGLKEYREKTYDTLSEDDQKYLDSFIGNVSKTIKETNDKYSEAITQYEEFLNNRLKYDNQYSEVYAKILEARAKVSEAAIKGDSKQLEEAKEDLNKFYKEAISQAASDPQVSRGMMKLLQEQIDEANEEIEKEQIGLKIGVQGDELFDSIQDILDEMGDISILDLKNAFDTGEITPKMQELKELLDENGISVEELTENFEYLGFSFRDAADEAQVTSDSIEALNQSISNSMDNLTQLETNFNAVYSAMDEFNNQGYISASTLQNLINNDLLQYLDFVNGKIEVNEAAMANAATAAKAKAIEDLQAKAAADIAAIAFGSEGSAASGAAGTTAAMTEKTNQVKNALIQMIPEVLTATDAWRQLNAVMGADIEGLSQDQINQINTIMNNLGKQIQAVNSIKISGVSYGRTSARGSGGGGSSSGSSTAAENAAKREAEQAAKEEEKAEEEAYKKRLKQFEDYIDEKERLENRWVKKQKELGLLSNEDYLYITQQRIERYKKYLEEVNKATWMKEEDRLKLQKEYTEEIEDLQLDYFDYLKDQLDDEIDAIKKANEEKIDLVKREADVRIDALKKVEDENDRIRRKEEYEKRRQEHLDDISYWEQRTGREAQEALKEAKKNLQELDEEWQEQLEDWSIEDQIKDIENERDAQIKAIEAAQQAEIDSIQAVYDEKVKRFTETGQIIYEGSVMQSKELYRQYKKNYIDPIAKDLAKLNQPEPKSPVVAKPEEKKQEQQYETYVIQRGDTLSAIARKYGTTVDKIMAANPYIKNRNLIYTGKTLQIPKFHEGGIASEGLALLKKNEMILKPEWTPGMLKLMKYIDKNFNTQGQSTSAGNKIQVTRKFSKHTS